ncbi:MAG TPA: DUF1109 domain-containing protein [Luteibacter sp.]|uniref:DUF1109 domain-containing protein n=1 Tax=Luteibacter sp. TaxID=1886636 RepID=UPI002BA1F27A|nr:DUF1109 domain-containing protein [Luteibacter sp.]HVI54504.1 DUF1109 domain-containing protein [Luteibacter sp.]
MKTDDFIAMLANEVPPVDRRAPGRRFALALLLGFASATLLMAAGLGVRPDLAEAIHLPMFWARLAFAAGIGGAALWLTLRLSRPGVRIGARWAGLAAPVAIAWTGMAIVLAQAPAGARVALLLGHTWHVCAILIALLSTPTFAAMLWAVRGMAPVRPRVTGAAVGLLAGATATMAYCLHCPEMSPAFWSTWYLLGMAIPAAVGALIGPRALRW